MITLKKLNLKNLKQIEKFTSVNPSMLCEMSCGVIFMWDKHYDFYYAVFDDTLILSSRRQNAYRFFPPVGKNVEGALREIEKFCVQNEQRLIFIGVDESAKEFLSSKYLVESVSFDRDFSDYIYSYEEIKNFVGKKFSGQRNHINAFKKLYPNYEYKAVDKNNVDGILEFLKVYKKAHKKMGKIEKKEYENTINLIKNLHLANFFGGYIEVDGEIVAVTIGERVGKMLVIHVEKANTSYRGAYPTIFNEFVKRSEKEGVIYINREDDSGDLGLRTSKQQYQPIMIANKYFVTVKNPMNVEKPPVLKGERVLLTAVRKSDEKEYALLYKQVKNNRFWGYDYKKYVENPADEYFVKMAIDDFKKQKNLCLAIRDKKSKVFMGEVVLYNFDYDDTVEIGFRLFKKYQKQGYAYESVRLVLDYVKSVLKLRVVAKCYKKNLNSLKLLEKLGFARNGEGGKHYYFECKN